MRRTPEQKQRVADYVTRQMAQRGWNRPRLVTEAGVDPATIRTLLAGETFPQTAKREAIEDALDVPHGTLELVASGLLEEEAAGDEVERAIGRSELNRANRAKLLGAYYEMLDEQKRGRWGA